MRNSLARRACRAQRVRAEAFAQRAIASFAADQAPCEKRKNPCENKNLLEKILAQTLAFLDVMVYV